MSSAVIVIGSGISGLTTAAMLAKKGRQVTIVEKSSQVGGALKRFCRHGIDFDIGFHYSGGLGEKQILSTLWRYLGIYDFLDILPFPVYGGDRVSFYGSRTRIHAYFSYPAIIEELERMFPGERQGIKKFFAVIKQQGESIPFFNLRDDLEPFLRSLSFFKGGSLADLVRSTVKNSELRALLALPVFLHGTAPEAIATILHAGVAHPVYSGMYTVNGGGRAIVASFMDILAGQGVRIITSCPAEELVAENGQVAGLKTAKGYLPASDVVFTGHPAFLSLLAPKGCLRKAYITRLNRLHNTPSMLVIFGAVKKGDLDDKSVWNNYYRVAAGLDFLSALNYAEKPCFFLSPCGLRDSDDNIRQAPYRAVILMRTASWQEVASFDNGTKQERADGYQEWKQKQTDILIEEAKSSFPGMMKNFKAIATSTPLTFRDELNYPEGSVYGISTSSDQFMIGPKTRMPGLWLSGQSTLMPGILGASLAALVTVGSMLDMETIWREIREWA